MDAPDTTGWSATEYPIGRSKPYTGGSLGGYPEEIWEVVDRVWYDPPSISSNYSRANAPHFALAASLGWITIIAPDGKSLSRSWHCTFEGLTALRNRTLMEGPLE